MSDTRIFGLYRRCCVCRKGLTPGEKGICGDCAAIDGRCLSRRLLKKHDCFDDVFCLFEYSGGAKRLMYDIKVNHDMQPLFHLAGMMASVITDDVDMVTYVPTYFLRRIIRGHYPPLILAREISKIKKIRFSKTLKRTTCLPARQQKDMTMKERFDKAREGYDLTGSADIRGRVILLIDDILTTGATLNICAGILKKYGARRVYAGIIASGRK